MEILSAEITYLSYHAQGVLRSCRPHAEQIVPHLTELDEIYL